MDRQYETMFINYQALFIPQSHKCSQLILLSGQLRKYLIGAEWRSAHISHILGEQTSLANAFLTSPSKRSIASPYLRKFAYDNCLHYWIQ